MDSTAESASNQFQSDSTTPSSTTTSAVSQDNEQYCYCCGPEEGSMIACNEQSVQDRVISYKLPSDQNYTKRQVVLSRLLCILSQFQEKIVLLL